MAINRRVPTPDPLLELKLPPDLTVTFQRMLRRFLECPQHIQKHIMAMITGRVLAMPEFEQCPPATPIGIETAVESNTFQFNVGDDTYGFHLRIRPQWRRQIEYYSSTASDGYMATATHVDTNTVSPPPSNIPNGLVNGLLNQAGQQIPTGGNPCNRLRLKYSGATEYALVGFEYTIPDGIEKIPCPAYLSTQPSGVICKADSATSYAIFELAQAFASAVTFNVWEWDPTTGAWNVVGTTTTSSTTEANATFTFAAVEGRTYLQSVSGVTTPIKALSIGLQFSTGGAGAWLGIDTPSMLNSAFYPGVGEFDLVRTHGAAVWLQNYTAEIYRSGSTIQYWDPEVGDLISSIPNDPILAAEYLSSIPTATMRPAAKGAYDYFPPTGWQSTYYSPYKVREKRGCMHIVGTGLPYGDATPNVSNVMRLYVYQSCTASSQPNPLRMGTRVAPNREHIDEAIGFVNDLQVYAFENNKHVEALMSLAKRVGSGVMKVVRDPRFIQGAKDFAKILAPLVVAAF